MSITRINANPILPEATAQAEETPELGASARAKQQRAKLKKVTEDFESVFIGQMLKQMRKSIAGENALFGKSSQSKQYQEMMDETTANQLSKTGQFGLAQVLYRSVERTLPPDPEVALKQQILPKRP